MAKLCEVAETEETATREEMITEAIKRIKMLDLHEDVLHYFEEDQTLYYSERGGLRFAGKTIPVGVLYWMENEEEFENAVKAFEEKFGGVVYHATYEKTDFGRCLDLFFVSRYKDEWQRDRRELLEKCPFVYVKNLDGDMFSEYGHIEFKECGGGLIRTA